LKSSDDDIGQDDNAGWTAYRGIRPDDPGGRCGLRNPERGLRLEAVIGHRPGSSIWSKGAYLEGRATDGYSDDWLLMNAARYGHYGVTLVQSYCYLDEFLDAPLSEQKLSLLQRSLDRCRSAGLKVLLRFAYEKDMTRRSGPTFERILSHIDQLAPLIRKNSDIVFVLQAGFVGAWGEWHSSAHGIEDDASKLAEIVRRLLEALPKERMIQVRVPRYKRQVLQLLGLFERLQSPDTFSGKPHARIGFHDDGFLAEGDDGGTWPEPPHFANPGNPEFDYMTAESAYLAVDGELFWSNQGGEVDGLEAAKRLRLHHYTSLSLVHSYSGYEGKPYSIDKWMQTEVTKADLEREALPISDGYFEEKNGRQVRRTIFEYIRDHLGYRLELQKARFPRSLEKGSPIDVEIELANRGFSTVINPRPVYLVLIDAEGELMLKQMINADPRDWQPYDPNDPTFTPLVHRITGAIETSGVPPGEYMLGLWLPDASENLARDSRFSIRVANGDVPWWTTCDGRYGVNILGNIRILGED